MIPEAVSDRITNYYRSYKPVSNIDFQYFIDNNIQDLIEEFS